MKNLKIANNSGSITIYNSKTKNVLCEIWCSDRTRTKKNKVAEFLLKQLKTYK